MHALTVEKHDGDLVRRKSSRSCRCGHRSPTCESFKTYSSGFCRRCGHARPCHKGGKS